MTPPPSVDLNANGSLLSYLTEPTQPVNLVRHLTISPGRGLNNYFWWDVRNLRSWEAFSLETISSIPGLLPLLNFGVDTTLFPQGPSNCTTTTPASEADLANIANKIYFPKSMLPLSCPKGLSHSRSIRHHHQIGLPVTLISWQITLTTLTAPSTVSREAALSE